VGGGYWRILATYTRCGIVESCVGLVPGGLCVLERTGTRHRVIVIAIGVMGLFRTTRAAGPAPCKDRCTAVTAGAAVSAIVPYEQPDHHEDRRLTTPDSRGVRGICLSTEPRLRPWGTWLISGRPTAIPQGPPSIGAGPLAVATVELAPPILPQAA
jgi:hypothetical protein